MEIHSILTWLIAQEDYTVFSHHSKKSYDKSVTQLVC